MRLSKLEKNWLFGSFLVLAVVSAGLEVYVIVRMIEKDITTLKSVVGVLNGGGLAYLLKVYIDILRKEYLGKDLVTEENLAGYFDRKLSALTMSLPLQSKEAADALSLNLTRAALRLLEEVLREWVGPYRYELSVFADPTHPEIVCYYDSAGHDLPRSHHSRQQDPEYYKKKKYEVVELLKNPSAGVIVIPNTRDASQDYSFVDPDQRQVIASTLLFCFSVDEPGAIVLVCNREDVFQQSDNRLITLIGAIGLAVRSEWEMRKKLCAAASS